MTKTEVIEEFCVLRREVMEHFDCDHATDCICATRHSDFGEFQDDRHSLKFIQDAVHAALKAL